MEYRCPIYESPAFTCDRVAHYLVAGTAICGYHALDAGLLLLTTGDPPGRAIITSDPGCQMATRNREGNHA